MIHSSIALQYPGNYPGFPGYYVMEGNILFGAKVVEPKAILDFKKQLVLNLMEVGI